jgi:SOS-response transcriptional repressor LexA
VTACNSVGFDVKYGILNYKLTAIMTNSQEKILKLAKEVDIGTLSLREIGEKVGIEHPQTVKNNLVKLRELGLLERVQRDDFFREVRDSKITNSLLYKIPILGFANCGNATLLAEEDFQGYLTLSSSFLKKRPNMFALIASGNSMNQADIEGENIEDGDYVVIDRENKSVSNGDYILSVIDGSANIKKLQKDKDQQSIVLLSESSGRYEPIYIHEDDFSSYFVNGKVIKVIKKPKVNS